LPGPTTGGCSQILEKRLAKWEKNSAFFQNYVFAAMNDKINMNLVYFENYFQKNLLIKLNKKLKISSRKTCFS
jgi:hypothetical protein